MSKSSHHRADAESETKCPHCKSGSETYRCKYFGTRYVFDVTRAREFVLDGREPVEVEEECLRVELKETRIHRQHLPHVDTKYPGIIAHVWYPLPSGELAHGHLLIDGNHRAARCLELNIPYFALVLTGRESYEILKKGPNLDRYFVPNGLSQRDEALVATP